MKPRKPFSLAVAAATLLATSFSPSASAELTDREASIVPIAAFTANGNQEQLKKALAKGLDNGLTVNEIVANISRLANNVLEPYLSVLPNGIDGYGKQWRITSGFRMNVSAPANRGSDHWRGRAVDIQLTGRNKRQHWELVQKLEPLVPYDQLLLEYRGRNSVWIHTGFRENGCRHQAFTMVNDRKYRDGFVLLA